jgi:hypothetical protein
MILQMLTSRFTGESDEGNDYMLVIAGGGMRHTDTIQCKKRAVVFFHSIGLIEMFIN